jgi:hypothetical protein
MKRSLEKSRFTITARRAHARDARDVIPCNAAAVNMGNSYCSVPATWKTEMRFCSVCGIGFQVTAAEQQYWFETLGIPFYVQIVHCPGCRKKSRARRRIANRLAELSPRVEAGKMDEGSLREFILLVTEGATRKAETRYRREELILPGSKILLKGCNAINQLLRTKHPQLDLLPILAHFHLRLGNVKRAARIRDEINEIRLKKPALAKVIDMIIEWMTSPTKRMPKQIIEPHR